MLKRITFFLVKFSFLLIFSVLLISCGLFLWNTFENTINVFSKYGLLKFLNFSKETLPLNFFLIFIGYLIKEKFPPKIATIYSLRWSLLFAVLPVILGLPYISQSVFAFFNILYMTVLFAFTGFVIGRFDYKFDKKLPNPL